MRLDRLIIVFMIIFCFGITTAFAQDEATQEATEPVEETMTAEPEVTAEATEESNDDDSAVTDGSTYVIQPGENLFRIALRYGLTTQELAEANSIANPNLIVAGQTLIIPGEADVETPAPTETPAPEATQSPEATQEPDSDSDGGEPPVAGGSYVVQPGDTLFRIAVRNNTTVANLLSLNPTIANPNLIFVGQRITLPEGSDSSSDSDSAATDDDTDDSTEVVDLDVDMSTGVEVFVSDSPSADASLLTQLGVGWVKVTVDWAMLEQEQGTIDFAPLDVIVDNFGANFDILLTLTGAPDWSRPSATDTALEQPAYGPPDDLADFGAFAGAIAERYAGQIDAYEIWFQPNNRLSWMTTDVELRSDGFPDAGLSDVRYIDLLEVAHDAIKAADSDALVLTAGLAPTGINDFYNSIDNFVFFEALLDQGAANFSDGFGIHIDGFSNAPDADCCGDADSDPQFDESYHFFFGETLDNFREILDRNGGASEPMWVTRFGWGTDENATGDPNLTWVSQNTAQEQADYTVAALDAGDVRGDVGAMILYNLNGCVAGSSTGCYYDLIDSTGNAREVFNAVAAR